MAAATRIYFVETPNSKHLVEAANASQAIRHVVKSTIKAEVCGAKDVAGHFQSGLKLETAAAE